MSANFLNVDVSDNLDYLLDKRNLDYNLDYLLDKRNLTLLFFGVIMKLLAKKWSRYYKTILRSLT